MSMSELYVDVNDTNTCSNTGTDAAPRMKKTDYHCQSHRSLGTIHSASDDCETNGSHSPDYDVFLNRTSTHILALDGTYYTHHTSRWNRTLTSRPQAPQRTNVFGRATRMDSTRFRKAGISARLIARTIWYFSTATSDRAQRRLRCTSTMSGRISTRLPSSLLPQRACLQTIRLRRPPRASCSNSPINGRPSTRRTFLNALFWISMPPAQFTASRPRLQPATKHRPA